jgi:hypothetical protein
MEGITWIIDGREDWSVSCGGPVRAPAGLCQCTGLPGKRPEVGEKETRQVPADGLDTN